MPFQKIETEKVATTVQRQIELLILRGVLRPGDRLPSERDMAEQFGVSRPSVRDAVQALETAGLLATRPGSGVFVADVLGSAFSPALVQLFSQQDEAVFDYLAFRRDLEGVAAERAARLASDADLQVIDAIFQRMTDGKRRDAKAEAQLDAEFHMSIIEASHNIVMLHMMRSMFELLREGVFYNRQVMFDQHTTKAALQDQHGAINAALQARDAEAARRAVVTHLDFVEDALRAERKRADNTSVAEQRMAFEVLRK